MKTFHVRDRRKKQANREDTGPRVWATFSLPERLVLLMREVAKRDGASLSALVESALSRRREPLAAGTSEPLVPFRIAIPANVRTHLERVAVSESTTAASVGERALRAWCEDIATKKVA